MTDDAVSRRALLRSGVAAGSLLLAGCSGNGSTTSEPTVPPVTAGPKSPTESETTTEGTDGEVDSDRPSVVVGERVLDEAVGFLVEGSSRFQQLGGPGPAPEGREYLVVVLSVKNRGKEALKMGNLTNFRVTNGEGTTQKRIRLVSQSGSQFTQGLIVPGETIRGFIAFEVAAGSEGWSFAFDVDSSETDIEQVTVDLAAEPKQPESFFQQSFRVPVHDVGASVTDADVTVTVSGVRTTDAIGSTKAPKGKEFFLPTVRVDNGKDRTAYFGLVGQMLLTGPRGTPQGLSLRAQQQLDNPVPLSPNIKSGEHFEGEVPYLVETGDSPLYFSFDFTANGGDQKAIWQLR